MSSPQRPMQDQASPNEFVVALRHLPLVRRELSNLPRPVDGPLVTESTILDLALVKIPEVDKVAAQIDSEPGSGHLCTCRRPATDKYPIDRVIRAIRESCREQYGCWTPLIGKNRTLDGVHTAQHVGTGSAAVYPSRATRANLGNLAPNPAVDRVTVGVLDTPLWPHPDLEGRYQKDESDVHLTPAGFHWHPAGHGTFVAALILQNSPGVDLVVRRGIGANGTALAWSVAEEMVLLAKKVDVLNVSFACFTDDDEEPLLLARAVEMIGSDKVIVAAAGNFADREPGDGMRSPNSPKSPMWPAASSRVIAVGAHDVHGERAGFSPDAPWVDLTAHGVAVASLYLKGTVRFRRYRHIDAQEDGSFDGYATWTGTSFAAAKASGAIARRIRRGPKEVTARDALEQVRNLDAHSEENVWSYPFAGGQ